MIFVSLFLLKNGTIIYLFILFHFLIFIFILFFSSRCCIEWLFHYSAPRSFIYKHEHVVIAVTWLLRHYFVNKTAVKFVFRATIGVKTPFCTHFAAVTVWERLVGSFSSSQSENWALVSRENCAQKSKSKISCALHDPVNKCILWPQNKKFEAILTVLSLANCQRSSWEAEILKINAKKREVSPESPPLPALHETSFTQGLARRQPPPLALSGFTEDSTKPARKHRKHNQDGIQSHRPGKSTIP